MVIENKNAELESIKTILDELIRIRNRPGLSVKYKMFLDARISMRSEQLLKGDS